jgi:hypothetical protein
MVTVIEKKFRDFKLQLQIIFFFTFNFHHIVQLYLIILILHSML